MLLKETPVGGTEDSSEDDSPGATDGKDEADEPPEESDYDFEFITTTEAPQEARRTGTSFTTTRIFKGSNTLAF